MTDLLWNSFEIQYLRQKFFFSKQMSLQTLPGQGGRTTCACDEQVRWRPLSPPYQFLGHQESDQCPHTMSIDGISLILYLVPDPSAGILDKPFNISLQRFSRSFPPSGVFQADHF